MNQAFEAILSSELLSHPPMPAEDTNNEAIKCPICCEICIDAIIESACNHTFCKKCLEKIFQKPPDGIPRCPQTRNPISQSQLGPNRAIRDVVLKVKVFCVLKDSGCKWVGLYLALENHLKNECAEVDVRCQNFGCDFVCRRKTSSQHLSICEYRPKQCKFCNSYFIANKIAEHEGYCPHQIILCPYGCGQKLKKKDVTQHHDNQCINALLPCEFEEFGCEVKVKRHRYQEHIKEYIHKHLDLLKEKARYYKNQWLNLSAEVNNLRAATKIHDLKSALDEKDQEIDSLKHNLDGINTANKNIESKNKELEQTIELLNNLESVDVDQNDGKDGVDCEESEESEDSDEEETKKDNTRNPNRINPSTATAAAMNSQNSRSDAQEGSVFHVLKQGWLLKRSKYLKQWRRRWIVLTPDFLYAHKEQSYSNPTEKIPIKNIERVSEGPQEVEYIAINIKLKDGNFVELKAKRGEEDGLQWIQKIQNCI